MSHNFLNYILDGIPNFCSLEYWQSVFQNAIGCTIGSAIAILASLGIYLNSINNAKISEQLLQQRTISTRLNAFAEMIKSALKTCEIQINNLELFADELKSKPIQFPKLKINPTGNLKRISETITFEKTGFAYTNYFAENSSSNEFALILNSADYFYSEFSMLPELIKQATINHIERKREVAYIFDKAYKLLNQYLLKLTAPNSFTEKMLAIRDKFQQNGHAIDELEPINNLLFVPLNQLIKSGQGGKEEPLIELFFLTSTGIDKYNDISVGYGMFELEIKAIIEECKKGLNAMNTNTKNLLEKPIN